MKRIILLTLTVFLLACTSEPEPAPVVQPTPTQPEPEPKMDCSKFFIEVDACREDHIVVYQITGNAPFSYQFVGLGATPFQDMFEEVDSEHKNTIKTGQRLQEIVINPYLDGIMCKQASVQVDLEDC